MSKSEGGARALFDETDFEVLCVQTKSIRSRIEMLRRAGFDPKIHRFIRGLRLSALLIYRIRRWLHGTGITASWGQLLNSDGNVFSPECDIIIHLDNEHPRWDGDCEASSHVMDYHFVPCELALAVISCKSHIRKPSDVDRKYADSLKGFVGRVWLFAECCTKGKHTKIAKAAKQAHYDGFWYLYDWSSDDPDVDISKVANQNAWNSFHAMVRQLAAEHKR